MTSESGRRPLHPGVILRAMLERRRISHDKAAKIIGISPEELNIFMEGRADMTPLLADTLAGKFGTYAETWHKLQSNHDNKGGR